MRSNITAIVLAAGKGTRMGSMCNSLPKPMLPIGGHSFLAWITSWLCRNQIPTIIGSGFQAEKIEDVFSQRFWRERNVLVIREPFPLGTGGLLRFVASAVTTDHIIALNGDTVLRLNVSDVLKFHRSHKSPVTQVVTIHSMQNEGAILISSSGRVLSFQEGAGRRDEMDIDPPGSYRRSSTGCYVLDTDFVLSNFQKGIGSLELEIMPGIVRLGVARAYESEGDDGFFDFGTPERYANIRQEPWRLEAAYGEPFDVS